MIITYYGGACVKLQYGERTLLFNPPSKNSKLKSIRPSADVVVSSLNHPDFTGFDSISDKENEPAFVINGPGEYEVGGTFFKGFPSKTQYGGQDGINTLYLFSFEDMNIAFLGALESNELDTAFTEAIDDISILFVPVGTSDTFTPSDSYELSVKLQPNIIIPILFDGPKDPLLAQFVKEGGATLSFEDKLTIKRKDIADLENSLRILTPQT